MTCAVTQFSAGAARTIAAAALLAALALAGPECAAAGDIARTPTAGTPPAQVMMAQATASPPTAANASGVGRVEARISMLHTKLAITPPQEELWKNVTQVMRDNAQAMETLTEARAARAKSMTAVDDLTSYAEIASAHANGLTKFIPVFQALYADMSDAQKAQADTLFRGHHRGRTTAKKMPRGSASGGAAAGTK
jgi:hypothetical protein